VADLVEEAFGRPAVLSRDDESRFEVLRRVLRIRASRRLVLVPIEERDVGVLQALLDEESRLLRTELCRMHLLRPVSIARDPTLDRVGSP
jgi:hypothetical protein